MRTHGEACHEQKNTGLWMERRAAHWCRRAMLVCRPRASPADGTATAVVRGDSEHVDVIPGRAAVPALAWDHVEEVDGVIEEEPGQRR